MPAASNDPGTRFGVRNSLAYLPHNFVPRFRSHQFKHHFGLSEPYEMAVTFDEPRDRQPPCQLDHAGLGAYQLRDLFVAADGDNPFIPRGQCLGLW